MQSQKIKGIRFDVFASTLIEFIAEEKVKKLKLLGNSLKLVMNARQGRDFSLDFYCYFYCYFYFSFYYQRQALKLD